MVKRRVYRLCRSLLRKNWPKYFTQIVNSINNSPNAGIGFLRPSSITSPLDDPKVDLVKGVPEDVSFQDQEINQQRYEATGQKNLQVGDHVYVDFAPSNLAKGFDSPVSRHRI